MSAALGTLPTMGTNWAAINWTMRFLDQRIEIFASVPDECWPNVVVRTKEITPASGSSVGIGPAEAEVRRLAARAKMRTAPTISTGRFRVLMPHAPSGVRCADGSWTP